MITTIGNTGKLLQHLRLLSLEHLGLSVLVDLLSLSLHVLLSPDLGLLVCQGIGILQVLVIGQLRVHHLHQHLDQGCLVLVATPPNILNRLYVGIRKHLLRLNQAINTK